MTLKRLDVDVVEEMKKVDYNLSDDMIIPLPTKEFVNEDSPILDIYIGRTYNSLVIGKKFKDGQIKATKVFSNDSIMICRNSKFLEFSQLSFKIKQIFPNVNPSFFTIVPYPYPSNWIAYALKNSNNDVIIFFDLPTGAIMVTT